MYFYTENSCHRAIKRSNCFHSKGRNAPCEASGFLYTVIFGIMEVILSQFPNLEKVSFLSYTAAAMSFLYSLIALYLCAVEFFAHREVKGNLLGVGTVQNISPSTKVWHSFQALGNIAFAYTYSMVLIEIQVRSSRMLCNYSTVSGHQNFKNALEMYCVEKTNPNSLIHDYCRIL